MTGIYRPQPFQRSEHSIFKTTAASLILNVLVKTENEKRRFVMKVQAFCEEKGLRSF